MHKGLEHYLKSSCPAEEGADAGKAEFDHLTERWKETEDPKLASDLEEASLLVWALVYGWIITRGEDFHRRYRVLQVEKELVTPLSPDVSLQSRLDGLIQELSTGMLFVLEFKTCSTKEPEYLKRDYEFNSQLWAQALAAEWDTGEAVQGTIIEGLYKGVRRSGTYSNSLLYAYAKNGELKPSYTKGWTKVRADQLEMGLKGWIDSLPEEERAEYFIRLDPILKSNSVVEDRLAIWVHKEQEAAHVLENGSEADKLKHFAPREGFWCSHCPFKEPCYGLSTVDDMIASGRLVPRVPHHSVEHSVEVK